MKDYGICIQCHDFIQQGDACSCYIIKIDMVDQSIKFPAPEIKQALKTYKNLYRKMKKKAGCKDPFPTFEIIYENIDIG